MKDCVVLARERLPVRLCETEMIERDVACDRADAREIPECVHDASARAFVVMRANETRDGSAATDERAESDARRAFPSRP